MTLPLHVVFRRSFFLSLALVACAPELESDAPAHTRQAIGSGNFARLNQGGVLVLGGPATCSGVLLAPNLVLTHSQCMTSREVSNGVGTEKVRIARVVPGSSELITLQLRKELPDALPRELRDVALTEVEQLTCFGFDATNTFTSGGFDILDLNGSTIALGDTTSTAGMFFTLERSDLGGFCVDHLGLVVAIITGATNDRGVGTATTIDAVRAVQRDLFFSLQETETAGAVTLVDDPGLESPKALTLTSNSTLQLAARVPGLTAQGFFLVDQGTRDAVLLLSAASAKCLAVSGTSLNSKSCARSDVAQVFWLDSVQASFSNGFTEGYRFQSWAANQCLTRQGGLASCTSPDTLFGMWLSGF